MKIGIVGAGNIGGTLGELWAAAGHEVMLSSRHPAQLTELTERLGPNGHADTIERAAEFGEIVLLAIPLKGVEQAFTKIQESFSGKIVMDAMNPFPGRDGRVAQNVIDREIASGVATQERLPDSRVVRVFSSVYYGDLQSEAHRDGNPLAIPLAGTDDEAKRVVADLVQDAGFTHYDLGDLENSKALDPGGILFGKSLTVKDMEQIARS